MMLRIGPGGKTVNQGIASINSKCLNTAVLKPDSENVYHQKII